MVIQNRIRAVRDLLRAAAASRSTVSFPQLFAKFEERVNSEDVWDTLEAASTQIADPRVAIYSALLAKGKTGVPGDGFFDTFKLHRAEDYKRIADDSHLRELTTEQLSEMVDIERLRVYTNEGA